MDVLEAPEIWVRELGVIGLLTKKLSSPPVVQGFVAGKGYKLLQNYLKLFIQELPRVPKAFCST